MNKSSVALLVLVRREEVYAEEQYKTRVTVWLEGWPD